MAWEGRGRGRRDEILARLNGRGAAREPGSLAPPVVPVPVTAPAVQPPAPASSAAVPPPAPAPAAPRVSFAPRSASADSGAAPPLLAPAAPRVLARAKSAPSARARRRRRSPRAENPDQRAAAEEQARFIDTHLVVLNTPFLRHNVQRSDGRLWLAVGFPSVTLVGRYGPLAVAPVPVDSHVSLGHLPAGLAPADTVRVLEVLRAAVASWVDPLPLTATSVSRWAGRVTYVPRPLRPDLSPLLLIADLSPLYASVAALATDAFAELALPQDARGSRTDYHLRLGLS